MSTVARLIHRTLTLTAAVALAATGLTAAAVTSPAAASERTTFVPGVTVNANHTVTFPLRTGRYADGRSVDYIVIEASSSAAAQKYGVKVVNKLANSGTAATQVVRLDRGTFIFSGTVDFSPVRNVVGSPGTGFPPVAATPGSRGDSAYSPIVRLPDGSFLNAPQIANSTGLHDKVVRIDRVNGTVDLTLTDGFARTKAVFYLSTDATAEGPAALEGSTYAPKLNAAPSPGDESSGSARAPLAAFVNGPTGDPATRQGLNSALLGEGDPLNILGYLPNQGGYSPLWDVHLSRWASGVTPVRLTQFDDVEKAAQGGQITAPGGGGAFGPSDFIVNCPIIALA